MVISFIVRFLLSARRIQRRICRLNSDARDSVSKDSGFSRSALSADRGFARGLEGSGPKKLAPRPFQTGAPLDGHPRHRTTI
jgi:hypothetical protein